MTAGFSEFGTDKPLTEDEVKDLKKPFNITLGGVIWREVNSELADFIEESNDPTSKNYLDISASWELGFTDYELAVLPKDSKNLEDGKIISDAKEIESYSKNLRALGGTGLIAEERVYRMATENVKSSCR